MSPRARLSWTKILDKGSMTETELYMLRTHYRVHVLYEPDIRTRMEVVVERLP